MSEKILAFDGGKLIYRPDVTIKIDNQDYSFPSFSVDEVLNSARRLKDLTETAYSRPLTETIEILDSVGDLWTKGSELRREVEPKVAKMFHLPRSSVSEQYDFLSMALNKHSIEQTLTEELSDSRCLDDFIQGTFVDWKREPRGLILNNQAENVFFLGPYSVLMSLLTKNTILMKHARGDPYSTIPFLMSIKDTDERIAEEISHVYWPGSDSEIYERLMPHIDFMVMWGGEESMRSSRMLCAKFGVSYMEHGPKSSFMTLLGITEKNKKIVADQVAMQMIRDRQRACNSPRAIFYHTESEITPDDFSGQLRDSLKDLVQEYPLENVEDDFARITELKRDKLMKLGYKLRHTLGPEATVAVGSLENARGDHINLCVDRAIVVWPFGEVSEVYQFIDENELHSYLQTWGVFGSRTFVDELSKGLSHRGVSYITSIDGMGLMGLPGSSHDGLQNLKELTTYVTRQRGIVE